MRIKSLKGLRIVNRWRAVDSACPDRRKDVKYVYVCMMLFFITIVIDTQGLTLWTWNRLIALNTEWCLHLK